MRAPLSAALLLVLSSSLCAQVPAPQPQPRSIPRAEWTLTPGVSAGPANRHWSQAAASDTKLYVFGGRTGTSGSGSKRNDLWELDGASLLWTELNADGDPTAPTQRFRNTLSYDPQNDQLVMFGGEDGAGNLLNDTWIYDFAQGAWSQVQTSNGPSARRFAQTAWDPSTASVLLFGGQDGSGVELGDTWLFSAGAWTQLQLAGAPGARGNHSLVTRSDFGDVFLCGGITFATGGSRVHYLDAWVWNAGGGGWQQIVTSTNAVPHGMGGNSTSYDPLRQRVILQGGQGISTNAGATGGAYGTAYGGSPSSWTSEFDCVTNEWLLYGPTSFNTSDPVLGRASRYYSAFLHPGGKVYLWGGQDPSGRANLGALKEYQANPVAASAVVGAGCNGLAGGPVTLTADRPWLGRTLGSRTTGLASGSLVFAILGQPTASTPLSALLPWGLPGCTLETTLDLPVALTNTGGGNAQFALPLPADPSLAGVAVRHQTLQFEVGATIGLSSSNGLELTLGVL